MEGSIKVKVEVEVEKKGNYEFPDVISIHWSGSE
jgi:hypothetical protein